MNRRPAEAEPTPLPAHVFQIMLSLLGGDSHGYAIIEDVAGRTEGRMELGTSTLYAVLKRLERIGWASMAEAPKESTDGRRKYYKLSARGRAALLAEARRIRELDRMLRESGLVDELGIAAEREA